MSNQNEAVMLFKQLLDPKQELPKKIKSRKRKPKLLGTFNGIQVMTLPSIPPASIFFVPYTYNGVTAL